MANVMNLVDVKAKVSRSGFDLSEKNAYTAKTGELLPVMVKEVIPGDKFKINLQSFTRTRPVNTSAYTRIREYYDFFFVPYTQLWQNWKTFATQMPDNPTHAQSINTGDVITSEHPYFTVNDVATYVSRLHEATNPNNLNELGFSRFFCTNKLLQYLDYGDFSSVGANLDGFYMVNTPLNPFPLLAYQKIYQDFYRNSQWEKGSVHTWNLDYLLNDVHIPVDEINIGNRNSMFDLRYCNWNKDYFMGLQPRSQFGDEAVVPLSVDNTAFTAWAANDNVFAFDTSDMSNPSATLQSLSLARKTDNVSPTEQFLNRSVYADAGSSSSGSPLGSRLARFGLSGSDLYSLRQALGSYSKDLSILMLRQYEMLQRYKEIQQSGSQDYKSQIEKLFGVSLSRSASDLVRYLGGFANNLDISEVVNTNLSDGNAADIAGKGVSAGQGYLEFDCDNEYGVLMCIYHNMPLLDYSLSSPTRYNQKYRFSDYALPVFDRIGMQEVPFLDLFNDQGVLQYLKQGVGMSDEQIMSWVIGYGPRYIDYKTSIDRIHGAFRSNLTDGTWVAPLSSDYFVKIFRTTQVKDAPGTPVKSFPNLAFNYTFMKVNPRVLDPIFANEAADDYDSDQFLINASFDIKVARNLDYDGLPY